MQICWMLPNISHSLLLLLLHTHTRSLCLSLSLSLSLPVSLCLCLSVSPFLSLCVCVSLCLSHTHTHMHTRARKPMHLNVLKFAELSALDKMIFCALCKNFYPCRLTYIHSSRAELTPCPVTVIMKTVITHFQLGDTKLIPRPLESPPYFPNFQFIF